VNGYRIKYINCSIIIALLPENRSIEFKDEIRENLGGGAKEGLIPLPWYFIQIQGEFSM
jgi:hypothetical protein